MKETRSRTVSLGANSSENEPFKKACFTLMKLFTRKVSPPALKLLEKASPKARSSRSKAQRKKILLRKSGFLGENWPK
ncbi:hypothetical protein [Thermococcus henrietii]|uniref:hypothetical protein n=1 Tax=Thermococcus henrietii TaxID=2016361 RepID=UPI0011AB8DF5|nr:hypothetical protein [Thermococcus henrietii]